MPALSKRMKHVLMLVSPHAAVADVGCDHGYMAIELIRSGKAEHVIAMDINEGPLARASANVAAYGLNNVIGMRLSDGMEALGIGEVQGVICAGMGGKTICGILERSHELVQKLEELVLQPQSELHIVRSYLRENGLLIAAEDMISEDGKFYPMMRAVPARSAGADAEKADSTTVKEACGAKGQMLCGAADGAFYRMEAEAADKPEADTQRQRVEDRYGPRLLAMAHPVLRQYLQKERAVCEEVLRSLSQTDTERGRSRREELLRQLSDLAYAEGFFV